jgi:DNA-binding response OmpR family regulator
MVHAIGAAPIRALIVADNRDICENIAAYLEKHCYVMDFAYDGISAMHLALTNPCEGFVLVVMLGGVEGGSGCQ